MNEVWTADRLAAMIEKKYPSDKQGYNSAVVLREVANHTGGWSHRWVDVVVFQMWQSAGLCRSAFEIKVSRQDFLRELAQPDKHGWVQESFHMFWFVAPADVIQVEELPVGAGFMYPRGEKLCIKRHAVRNPNPKLDDVLLAAFMRSAWKSMKASRSAGEKESLAASAAYQRAKIFEEATQTFLAGRRVYVGQPEGKEAILSALREATMDTELKQERDHLMSLLEGFQENLLNGLSSFLVMAGSSLLEKDELGHYLLNRWGANDLAALKVMSNLKRSKEEAAREEFAEMVRKEAKP